MEKVKTTVKLSPELHGRIAAIAEREHRSAHAQMLLYLERGVEQDGQTDNREEQ